MRRQRSVGRSATVAAAALAIVALASATGAAERDRALRNATGVIASVRSAPEGGDGWIYATLREEGSASAIELRVGPADLVAASDIDLRAGDRVQVRLFVGDPPNDVQRIRSGRTGRVLRVRCLNGAMVWTGPGRHGGPGRGGRRAGEGSTPRPSSPRRP